VAEELSCRMGMIEQIIRYTYWSSRCQGIVVGMSGGVDSSVAASFCCRALGPERVLGLSLPSLVNNPQDVQDAALLCAKLGMEHRTINIEPILQSFRKLPEFTETPYLLGNMMARIRMVILYYHANRENRLVCGTSNRSEYMLGYCTKFGDNAADIQPIVHLYKTEIYEVAEELGIPESILRKAPSAGLWDGQSDEGEIGLSYSEIDASLKKLEENNWNPSNSSEKRILDLVHKSGHKRLRAPNLLTELKEPGQTVREN